MEKYNGTVYTIGTLKVSTEVYENLTQEDCEYIAACIGRDAQYIALMSCLSQHIDLTGRG